MGEWIDSVDKLKTILEPWSEKSGLSKFHILAIIAVVVLLIINLLGFDGILVNIAGFAYPAYASFKAIETPEKADDKQWLTYWVVFAFFNLLETITDLFKSWIPFYFYLKLAFLVALFHPEVLLATTLYEKFLKPQLLTKLGIARDETSEKKD